MPSNIIDNRLGEPDAALVPHHIRPDMLPLQVVRDHYITKYGAKRIGLQATREAIAKHYAKTTAPTEVMQPLNADNIVMVSGTTHAIHLSINFIAEQSKKTGANEVLLLNPCYYMYKPVLKENNISSRYLETRNIHADSKEEYERILFHKICHSITDKTGLFILTDPDNPTGRRYSDTFKQSLLQLQKQYPNLHILHDTVYRDVGRSHLPKGSTLFTLADADLKKRIIEISSVSKSFAPSIRAGWMIADKSHIDVLEDKLHYSHGELSNAVQLVLLAGLEASEQIAPNYFEEINRIYDQRVAYTANQLRRIKGLTITEPEGSFYVFIDFSNIKGLDADTVVEKAKKNDIFLMNGRPFGAPNTIRLNAARPGHELEKITETIIQIAQEHQVPVASYAVRPISKEQDRPHYHYKPYLHSLGMVNEQGKLNTQKDTKQPQSRAKKAYADMVLLQRITSQNNIGLLLG